jgi:hypothetical protein
MLGDDAIAAIDFWQNPPADKAAQLRQWFPEAEFLEDGERIP